MRFQGLSDRYCKYYHCCQEVVALSYKNILLMWVRQVDILRCYREPVQEIYDAAKYLDSAVSAHLNGHTKIAGELFKLANNPNIWNWTDSIWGKNSLGCIHSRQRLMLNTKQAA